MAGARWRRAWWISRRGRRLPWWRRGVSRRRFPRRSGHVPWRRLSRRPRFPRRRLPPRRVRVSAPPLSSALLRVLLRLPVLLFVPPLPGDLDLLWPAQDLPLPPLASPPLLASSPLLASPSPASSLLLMSLGSPAGRNQSGALLGA